jgi:hypothetical protein
MTRKIRLSPTNKRINKICTLGIAFVTNLPFITFDIHIKRRKCDHDMEI